MSTNSERLTMLGLNQVLLDTIRLLLDVVSSKCLVSQSYDCREPSLHSDVHTMSRSAEAPSQDFSL